MGPVPAAVVSSLLSRRAAIRVGAAVLGLAVAGASAGCAAGNDDEPPEPDPLLVAVAAARRDAETATAAAALAPERAGALAVIANERIAHADALTTEITRASGASTPSATASAAPTSTGPSTPPPTVDQLRTQLAESQRGAADLARRLDGYRAGLLGSISAAVAAQQAVLLP
ncbi:hypothetical protein [Rhodococcus sp. NPDC127528]|uniref:hypothetical protein n=1 Tax=unclassified Rhodococcus (in: high G+C Gram-positive bacteria) TaxID=192944 RepID=UPI0036360F7C